MEYAEYEFYIDKYHGKLSYDLFNSLIVKASLIVKRNINRKLDIKNIPDEIKYVVCELLEHINELENSNITSIDGVTIAQKTKEELDAKQNEILSNLPQEYTRYL